MKNEEIIEKVLKEAWEEHRPHQTYDTEGINHLVRIAIQKALTLADENHKKEIEELKNEK